MSHDEATTIDATVDISLLVEHLGGSSYRDLATVHDISRETVRRRVTAEGQALVDSIEAALRVASVAELTGAEQVAWPCCLIPGGEPGPDWLVACRLFDLVVGGLRSRGHVLETSSEPAPDGGIVVTLRTALAMSPN